jgi:hypothetical protein
MSKRDKINKWFAKMNNYYLKVSDRKLEANLKSAGFRVSKKTKEKKGK